MNPGSSSGCYTKSLPAESDRQHPRKKNRPVASGAVSSQGAGIYSYFLMGAAAALSYLALSPLFLMVLLAYLLLNIAYSSWLKHLALVDVICIATGFVLRVLAGGAACRIWVSNWMILMAFLLALFIAFAKRRDDLVLRADRDFIRKNLGDYNLEFVDTSMVLTAGMIVVVYIMYATSPDVVAKHGTDKLYASAIWVILGILRYFQITFVLKKSGSPSRILIKDFFFAGGDIWLDGYDCRHPVSRGALTCRSNHDPSGLRTIDSVG